MTRFALGLGMGCVVIAVALPMMNILRDEDAPEFVAKAPDADSPDADSLGSDALYLMDDMTLPADMAEREEHRPSLPAPPAVKAEEKVATAPALPLREVEQAPIFTPNHDSASLATVRKASPVQDKAHETASAPAILPVEKPKASRRSAFVPKPDITTRPGGSAPLWHSRAVPVSVPNGRPKIAIVLDDMGLSVRKTVTASDLRGPLTLAFLPYGHKLEDQVDRARKGGHEIIMHMPMQPGGDANPGPDALQAGMSPEEVDRRLTTALAKVPHIVGFNNHMGSNATADPLLMKQVAEIARREGMIFLDSRTTALTAIPSSAEAARADWLERDVFLDNRQDKQAILRELARTEQIARQMGHAIALGHPHPETLDALRQWLPQARSKGIAIVPISHLMLQKTDIHHATAQ